MLSQDYNAAAAAVAPISPSPDPNSPEDSPEKPPPPVRSSLEVPKLRDLKSHSFPPPWSTSEDSEAVMDPPVAAAPVVVPPPLMGELFVGPPGPTLLPPFLPEIPPFQGPPVPVPALVPGLPFPPPPGLDPFWAGSQEVAARLAALHMFPSSPMCLGNDVAEERRRRWLLYNHTISCSGELIPSSGGVGGEPPIPGTAPEAG